MSKETVIVDGKEMFVIARGSCMTEVSDVPNPSDRLGSTQVIFNSMIQNK
jgi:hypothetical protein